VLVGTIDALHCPLVNSDEVDHCKGALRDEGQWMHERVAALACWCAGIGISALTVYDADGCLVDAVEELVSVDLQCRPHQLRGSRCLCTSGC